MAQQTKHEHMQWCKQRALEYLQPGQYFSLDDAMASMASDLGKHPETQGHIAIGLMFSMRTSGMLNTADQMRKFINDFN